MEYIPIISLVIALLVIPPIVIWLDKRKAAKKRTLIIEDQRQSLFPVFIPLTGTILLVFCVLALVGGCSKESDEPDTIAGAESEKISFPAFPNFPNVFPSPTTTTPATTPATTPVSTGSTTEQCSYAGRYNGDRAQWYCKKKMSAYPSKLTVIVSGCYNVTITNNGSRYEKSGLIVKQSDVSGRGMAIVAQASCKSTTASIKY